MSDFFSLYRDDERRAPTPGAPRLEPSRPEISFERPAPPHERHFFERIFAPFQAPQEGLFHLTRAIGEEGRFRPHMLLDAMGHAARYFNPWSNVDYINPDEIRRVFMGKDADWTGFAAFGANLAISLLYDPLLLAGFAKAVGLVAKGGRAHTAIRHITNPAGAAITLAKKGARELVGPTLHRMGRAVMGDTKWEYKSTQVIQWLFKRHAGVDDELVRAARRMENQVADWGREHYSIMRQAEKLRGRETSRILAEALQTEAAYLNRAGRTLSKKQAADLAKIETRLRESGVSQDLFWQVYDRMRQLDDNIGNELYRLGIIALDDVEVYRGTHLRRMYEAFEKPMDYIDRIEKLTLARPDLAADVERVSVNQLKRGLKQLKGEVAADPGAFRPRTPKAPGPTPFVAPHARHLSDVSPSPYLDRQRGNIFDVDRFAVDLVDWLDGNSSATAAEVFEHVQKNMMRGARMTEGFWESIGQHLSGARYTSHGLRHFADRIRELAHSPAITWRRYKERLEIVARRENLRPEIAEALGEIMEAAPRMTGEVTQAGKLLETRRFLDQIAGVQRVSEETGTLINRAKDMLARNERVPQDLLQEISEKLGRKVSPSDLFELDTGRVLSKTGSRLASLPDAIKPGHTMQLPLDPSYGELAGMYTTPGNWLMLRKLESVGGATEPATKMANKLTELIRRGTGQFKVMKVIMDPVAQFRNFIGNAILMDLMGTNPLRVDRMIKSGVESYQFMRHGKRGRYLEMLYSAGVDLFDTTFTQAELMQYARYLSPEPITRGNWKQAFVSMYDAMRRTNRNAQEFGMQVFEFNERLFKFGVFIDKYEDMARGVARAGKRLTPDVQRDIVRQAANLAEQALFNYADVPYAIDFMRKYGVVPFATFPFKAIPYTSEMLYQHPHRVLKYNRTVEEHNRSLAGGPDEVAREIQALPQHLRQSMVIRMPFNDGSGRPQYVDMAYYMPWQPLQQLIEQVGAGLRSDAPGDYGLRGGVLTPPLLSIFDAVRHNQGGLGRPIVNDSMSTAQKWHAVGKFITEFWMPPSGPGGTRMESVGRSLQAMATTNPEVQNWVNILGQTMRLGAGQDRIVPRAGMMPQTQAQVDSWLGPVGGALTGLIFGGSSAVDPAQSRANEAAQFRGSMTDLARQIAQIRSNPSLSIEEKRKRIARLRAMQQELQEDTRTYLGRL